MLETLFISVLFFLPGAAPRAYAETAGSRDGGRSISAELQISPDPAETGKQALRLLIREISNPDPDVVVLAAEAFGEVGNPSAKKLLAEKLRERDGFVRIAAARALWKLGDDSGIKVLRGIISRVPPAGKKKSPLLEMKALSLNKIRQLAVRAVADIEGAGSEEFLLKLKNDPYGGVRDEAAAALARLGREEESAQFTAALVSEDEGLRLAGATALSRICGAYTLDAVKAAMRREKSAAVKIALLETMSCIGDIVAMPEILDATGDSGSLVRLKAVLALSGISSPAALSKVKGIYEASNDIYLRVAAMRYLASSGEKVDLSVLEQAMGMTDPNLKTQALSVLEKTPGDEAFRILDNCLLDQNPAVQIKAASQILRKFKRGG